MNSSCARLSEAWSLGSAAGELFAGRRSSDRITLEGLRRAFDEIAVTRTAAAKATLLKALLERATPLEAKYILKIITGELRIGLKESLVEEAIAKAYDEPFARVQRANMLLGDIGATLKLAAEHQLDDAKMRLFHPIGFMLASPAASAEEAFEYFEHAQVEDKYDASGRRRTAEMVACDCSRGRSTTYRNRSLS